MLGGWQLRTVRRFLSSLVGSSSRPAREPSARGVRHRRRSPRGPIQGSFRAVRCMSATGCIAVGKATLPGGSGDTTGFVANLTDGSWVQGLLPLPAGASTASLSARPRAPPPTRCLRPTTALRSNSPARRRQLQSSASRFASRSRQRRRQMTPSPRFGLAPGFGLADSGNGTAIISGTATLGEVGVFEVALSPENEGTPAASPSLKLKIKS